MALGKMASGRRRATLWLLTTALVQLILQCSATCPSVCSCLGDTIDCSKSGITQVPSDLPKWVERLDLSQNPELSLTPGVFSNLPHLTSLHLQRLGLDRLPPLGHLPSLRSLFLGNNRLRSVEALRLEGLPNLQELDLSRNKLVSLSSKAFANVTLIRLNLSRNMIRHLDGRSFRHLTSLAELKLTRNLLTPGTFNHSASIFTNLTNLRLLDLNGNRLHHLQGLMFEPLKKLKILKLRRNEIASFSDGVFYGLDSIDKLYLDHNNLTVVSKGLLFGLNSLAHLSLDHNHIDSVRPDAWKSTQRLVTLEVSNNRLVSLREGTFRGLGSLTSLRLSHNHLAHIEHHAFRPTSSLALLALDHNELRWSVEDNSGAFSSLGQLRTLSLAYNSIETIHAQTFEPLASLTTLDLLGNELRTLPHNPFSNLRHLATVLLNTSSLVCDCHLAWLPAWLASLTGNSSTQPSSSTASSMTVSCNYPASLREREVATLRPSDFSCESSPRPEIKSYPGDQIILHGTNVTLACTAQAGTEGDTPKFMWRKNNQLLVDFEMETLVSVVGGDGRGGAVYNVTSLLRLQNVSEADSGEYQCVVRNHYGANYSPRSHIRVHIFPHFTKSPSSIGVKVGEVARLECVASGSPPPEISLLKDGGDDFPAARERRIHVFKNETIFFIKPVRPHDEGNYTCRATNAAGTATANATVSVRQIPEFTKPPKDELATLGDNALLECQGTGLPMPRVTWSRDGVEVEEDGHFLLVEDSQYLLIKETRVEDVGTYVCELTNILGTARARLTLSLRETGSSSTTTGIVVMAVVCCVVVTSLVWVVIIHQTRKRAHRSPAPPPYRENGGINHRYPSSHPMHLTPELVHHTFTPLLPGPQDAYRAQDSGSEHSSGKDSGTGDSAGQRSNEDLLPLDLARPGVRRSLMACGEPGSPSPGLRGMGDGREVCDDLPAVTRPRLSTFSPQHHHHHHHHHHLSPGSYSPGLYTASLRRSSNSRLLPVSTPVTPSSTLPRPVNSQVVSQGSPFSQAASQAPTVPPKPSGISTEAPAHRETSAKLVYDTAMDGRGQCTPPQQIYDSTYRESGPQGSTFGPHKPSASPTEPAGKREAPQEEGCNRTRDVAEKRTSPQQIYDRTTDAAPNHTPPQQIYDRTRDVAENRTPPQQIYDTAYEPSDYEQTDFKQTPPYEQTDPVFAPRGSGSPQRIYDVTYQPSSRDSFSRHRPVGSPNGQEGNTREYQPEIPDRMRQNYQTGIDRNTKQEFDRQTSIPDRPIAIPDRQTTIPDRQTAIPDRNTRQRGIRERQSPPQQIYDTVEVDESGNGDEMLRSPHDVNSESPSSRGGSFGSYGPRGSICSSGDRRSELDLRIDAPEVWFKNTGHSNPALKPR